MATRTTPLVSAATLASAAAIAVAGTAIAPSFNLPTPHALSAAKVQLATFTDVLSIPAVEWTNVLFSNTGYGGRLSETNYGPEWAKPQDLFLQPGYVNPWAVNCTNSNGNGSCFNSGITGVAYLFSDALINGQGLGWDNRDQWSLGVPTYLFEPGFVYVIGGGSSPGLQFVQGGWSATAWFLLQGTVGQAIPELTVPIAAAFIGEYNVSVFYNLALTVAAGVIGTSVPVVGPLVGNTILAYLGDLETPDSDPADPTFYQYGLSGALNYWINVLNGSEPLSAAATLAAAATPAVAAASVATPEAPESAPAADAPESAPAADAPESTPAGDAPESTPAADAPESTPAVETPAAETPAVSVPENTPAVTETEPVEVLEVSVPEVEDITGIDEGASEIDDVVDSTPAKSAPKRPVRDAVEKVTKQITSAIKDSRAAKAAAAKADKADSAS